MTNFISFLLAALLSLSVSASAQQATQPAPAAPAPPPVAARQPASSSGSSSSRKRDKAIPSFLILGTVFDEKAIAFPGVQVRIRRTGEKKFRWEAFTNSRGEFAVRVPPGSDYEVSTHMKHYRDQSQSVDSKAEVQQRLSIKLERLGQAKNGAQP